MNKAFSERIVQVPWATVVVQFIWNRLSELVPSTYRVFCLSFPAPKARAHEYVLPMSGRTLAVALTGFSIPSSSYPYQLLAFNPDILSSLAFQFHCLSLIVAQKMSSL